MSTDFKGTDKTTIPGSLKTLSECPYQTDCMFLVHWSPKKKRKSRIFRTKIEGERRELCDDGFN
ncbi:hypothetical protein H5410_059267 [Solanum commersonii]|uniref:Uncharacterized protein n=1 Tax=Solanum commersonii TaxID=4109 RepID=A0A9J5W1Y3_SOLCO|nr:hypothetical protein H5410_059267 [Solanum commersonii]